MNKLDINKWEEDMKVYIQYVSIQSYLNNDFTIYRKSKDKSVDKIDYLKPCNRQIVKRVVNDDLQVHWLGQKPNWIKVQTLEEFRNNKGLYGLEYFKKVFG